MADLFYALQAHPILQVKSLDIASVPLIPVFYARSTASLAASVGEHRAFVVAMNFRGIGYSYILAWKPRHLRFKKVTISSHFAGVDLKGEPLRS